MLYDGSPFHPDVDAILRHTAAERATFIRLTPKYVEALEKAGIAPRRTLDLSALRTMIVSSSPFGSSGYDYIYRQVKSDLHLGSPAGGTDPLGSLVSANPIGPVWPGEIQARALGMKVEIFDDHGRSIIGQPGELVVTMPFPSMPLGFWGDADGGKYRDAYFNVYPDVWRHGDWAEINRRGGVRIFGRSDATLKASGIRFGTAEIYRQLEGVSEIADSVVVAQDREKESRIILFIVMRSGVELDDALARRIKDTIRRQLSPRHVPDAIIQVSGLPLTITGKVSELAVQEAIHGREVKNLASLKNPEVLRQFAPDNLPPFA